MRTRLSLPRWLNGMSLNPAFRGYSHVSRALHFDLAVLWAPRQDELFPTVVWHDRLITQHVASTIRALRLGRGVGLAGHVWLSREAASVVNILDDPRFEPHHPLAQAGLVCALAVPVLVCGEVLAVLGFVGREPTDLTDRMMSALAQIGSQIGVFFSRRKQQLAVPALTRREREVLQLAADGHSVVEIAERLNVGRSTVKTHFENTYKKLGVHDRTSAVAEMMRQGLIS